MSATYCTALDYCDGLCTKQLVLFDNVLPRYSTREDVTIQYTLGSHVCPTPVDWVGIFQSECRDISQPLTFQWVPLHLIDRVSPRQRYITFPSRLIQPLQHPTDSYQLMYINNQNHVVGVSRPFLLEEVTTNRHMKPSSLTSTQASTQASADPDERNPADPGERHPTNPGERVQGERVPSDTDTSESQLPVSSGDEWDCHNVSVGQRSCSSVCCLTDVVALPLTPCRLKVPSSVRREADHLQTKYNQVSRVRETQPMSGGNLVSGVRETQPMSGGNLVSGVRETQPTSGGDLVSKVRESQPTNGGDLVSRVRETQPMSGGNLVSKVRETQPTSGGDLVSKVRESQPTNGGDLVSRVRETQPMSGGNLRETQPTSDGHLISRVRETQPTSGKGLRQRLDVVDESSRCKGNINTCRIETPGHVLEQHNCALSILIETHQALDSTSPEQQSIFNKSAGRRNETNILEHNQKVVNKSTQEQKVTDKSTQDKKITGKSTQEQKVTDKSTHDHKVIYMSTQEQHNSTVTEIVSQKIGGETINNRFPVSVTLPQELETHCEEEEVEPGEMYKACFYGNQIHVSAGNGKGHLSNSGIAQNITTSIPTEVRTRLKVGRTKVKAEHELTHRGHDLCLKADTNAKQMNEPSRHIRTYEQMKTPQPEPQSQHIKLKQITKETRLVRHKDDETQIKRTSLKHELAEAATDGTKQEQLGASSRNTNTAQHQQKLQVFVPVDRQGGLHQYLDGSCCYHKGFPTGPTVSYLQSPRLGITEVVTAGRKHSLNQKVKVKKKKKKRLQTKPSTKVHSRNVTVECEPLHETPTKQRLASTRTATDTSTSIVSELSHRHTLLTSLCGHNYDTKEYISKGTATEDSGSLPYCMVLQDGRPLALSKIWEPSTEDVSLLPINEVKNDNSTQVNILSGDAKTQVNILSGDTKTQVNILSEDAASCYRPSDGASHQPNIEHAKNARNAIPHCPPGLCPWICSSDLMMTSTVPSKLKNDHGMLSKYNPILELKSGIIQKELQNRFMKMAQNPNDKQGGDSESWSRTSLLHSKTTDTCTQSVEIGSAFLDRTTCESNGSEIIQVGPARSERLKCESSSSQRIQVSPSASNTMTFTINYPENRVPPREVAAESHCCDRLTSHVNRLAEIDNRTDSLSWPFPIFLTRPPCFGPWVTLEKMKHLSDVYTENELMFKVNSHPSQKLFMINRSAVLESSEMLSEPTDSISHTCASTCDTRAANLRGDMMKSLAEKMELRDKLELLQFELMEPTIHCQNLERLKHTATRRPQARALGRRRPITSAVRHRRVPLVKYAGTIKTSIRYEEQIFSLKSKAKKDDLLIGDLKRQLFVLKEALISEACKVERGRLKLLKLKRKFKEYKEKLSSRIRSHGKIPNKYMVMEPGKQPETVIVSLGNGDCGDMEPPSKKRRVVMDTDDYMKDETGAILYPSVREADRIWQLKSCPPTKLHTPLASGDNQVPSRDVPDVVNIACQNSNAGVNSDCNVSSFCRGSGCLSAFNPSQQTSRHRSCIDAWSRSHVGPGVTPCHHNITFSCVGPVGSHRHKFSRTKLNLSQQHSCNSCYVPQTLTTGRPSTECCPLSEWPNSSPARHGCCCFPRQYQTEEAACPEPYDRLTYAASHTSCHHSRRSAFYRPVQLPVYRPVQLPVTCAQFSQCSPLSCNNSRNKSRESSASDCQHISPLPSPSLLPIPAPQTHWSSRGRRSSPRTEVVKDNPGTASSDNTSQRCITKYVSMPVQPCNHAIRWDEQEQALNYEHNSSLYWPAKRAEETENYLQSCAIYKLSGADVTVKSCSSAVEAGSKMKARVEPFRVSGTCLDKDVPHTDKMFAYASGATVCPEASGTTTPSHSASKWLTATEGEGINNNQLLGIFSTPHRVSHQGSPDNTSQNLSVSLIAEKDDHQDPLYSHFQCCFLDHIAKEDSHKLQQAQLQAHDHTRPAGHKHCRHQEYLEKARQEQQQSHRLYRYPRTPLALPPSELPYPPLSPFHHAASTQVRKTNALMLSDSDVEQDSDNNLSEGALLDRLPQIVFHDDYHSLDESGLQLPASRCTKHEDHFAIRSLLENPGGRENSSPVLDLRAQSLREVLHESALLASEVLIDKRQIEARLACHLNPQE